MEPSADTLSELVSNILVMVWSSGVSGAVRLCSTQFKGHVTEFARQSSLVNAVQLVQFLYGMGLS